MKTYYQTRAAVYIMFENNGKVLLAKRCNTGYKDGCFAFIQGHIEDGETPTSAAIREAFEEAGVVINPSDLEFGLVCHNRVDTHYTDYFFVCRKWSGDICNMEPDKCEEIKWFPINNIPENAIFQVKEYITGYLNGKKLLEIPEL